MIRLLVRVVLSDHDASTRILKRNGFVYSGIVKDHEIGDAWEWILNDNMEHPHILTP